MLNIKLSQSPQEHLVNQFVRKMRRQPQPKSDLSHSVILRENVLTVIATPLIGQPIEILLATRKPIPTPTIKKMGLLLRHLSNR
jgi:hypothetical protein